VVAVPIAGKVPEKAGKAQAKPHSNHSPAPHGGSTPLCGLEIFRSLKQDFPQQQVVAMP